MSETPRVWVGSLGLYNAGFLIGAWFDATEAPQTVEEFLSDESVAAQIGERGAEFMAEVGEELWCFDLEGFGSLIKGECSPAHAAQVAQLIEDAAVWDIEVEHIESYMAYTNTPVDKLDEQMVRDAFKGEVEKAWHYYFDLYQETHGSVLDRLPDEIRHSIDWEDVTTYCETSVDDGIYFDEIAHNRVFVWEA